MEPDLNTPEDLAATSPEMNTHLPHKPNNHRRFWVWFILFDIALLLPLIIAASLFYLWHHPPTDFSPQLITIEPGESVIEIAAKLEESNIVQSRHVLFTVLRYWQDPTKIKASTYTFTEPIDVFAVADKLIAGEFDSDLVSLTFIEGESMATFGRRAAAQLESFDQATYDELTTGLEGRLFPETYRVPPDFTTTELVELLTQTHDEILQKYEVAIAQSELSVEEIIILASILEREANTEESKRTVAGIFMNRLAIGMPLQADATIEYALETPLGELPPGQLAVELRELDTPYNTYLYNGLPPTPIGNPGELAIRAVIDPLPSNYFYYITGNDGKFYYAESYDQHLAYIERHLR